MAVGLRIVEGDFIVNESGTLETLLPSQKCARDLGKVLVTEIENYNNETEYYRYNPNYGTYLNNTLLYSNLSRVAARDAVVLGLNTALANYLSLQESRLNLDMDEIITGINFDVMFNAEDMKELLINIRYTTLSSGEQTLGQFSQTVA